MHYYQHHIGDFIKATARLTDAQSMAYLRLLWMYYDTEKPLKPDIKLLAFQIGTTEQETNLILNSFFTLTDRGWMHTRCEEEIAEYHSFLEKKSNAGRASAERRKHSSSTGVEQVLNSSSTNHITTNHITSNHITIKEKKNKNRLTSEPDVNQFDEIRLAYPRRGGSQKWGDAEKAYKKRLAQKHTHEEILAGVQRYKDYLTATGGIGTQYVQQAATFLGENKGFLEPWTPPAMVKDVRQMSAPERVRMAMSQKDDRVVDIQGSRLTDVFDLTKLVR